jgi:hypothetical protein
MCLIGFAYFKVNGFPVTIPNCTAKSTDTLNVEAGIIFSTNEAGLQYKCEMKISAPGIPPFSLFTPLRTVNPVELFTSPTFPTPIPAGLYTCTDIVIYDSSGNTICNMVPVTGGTGSPCNTVTISTEATAATVAVSVSGNGTVRVSRNNGLLGETKTSQVFNFTIGDTFKFEAVPDAGNSFNRFCADTTCTIPTNQNPFTGTITTAIGSLFTYFVPIGAAGSINFVSNPVGSEIFLDNSDQQHVTPFTINGIPVGTHSYRLTLANYPDITGVVPVQANQIAQVSADFTTGKASLGIVIIGVGIAAALMAGLYYILRKPGKATSIVVSHGGK